MKLLMMSAAIATAVAFVACDDPAMSEDDNIPTDPIEEMSYSPEATSFEVWAPTAESVVL